MKEILVNNFNAKCIVPETQINGFGGKCLDPKCFKVI